MNLNILNNSNEKTVIISKKIYSLNVEYYLTFGANYQRLNKKPFLSCFPKKCFNYEDLLEIIDNENVLSIYEIDDLKYFNEEKKVFQKVTNNNNYFKDKLILEFHIYSIRDLLMSNLKLSNKYINKEIINLKYRFNKLSDATKPYDLIYLYASPIVLNEYNLESESPISYMEEIRIIIDLMKHSKKQFNCKFECINENVLRDNLINNKAKILHISAHGEYDG